MRRGGRAWLMCLLVSAGLAGATGQDHAPPAPQSPRFTMGSVPGPWAFLELGLSVGAGTFVDPSLFSSLGPWTSLTAGWGVEAGPVHLRPAIRLGLAYEAALSDDRAGRRFSLTPVMLSLAATDLVHEKLTGLRLTPAVGFTIPTATGRSIALTTLSLALQLERRFGPVELALRSELGKPLYGVFPSTCSSCPLEAQPDVNWSWLNTLQVEGWFTDSLSCGLSLGWNLAWGFPVSVGVNESGPVGAISVSTRDRTTGRVFFSWAFERLFGLSFEVNTTQAPWMTASTGQRALRFPFLSFGAWADNTTVLFLSLWFRTDPVLSRNWIER